MIFNLKEREYAAPSFEVVDVACEAGYRASSGDLTFDNGFDDGWYGI